VVPGKQKFGGDNVLPDFADMLPGKNRRFDLDAVFIQDVEMFDHDHGIGVVRQHMPGIDVECILIYLQLYGLGRIGAEGGNGGNSSTIHGGRMKMGRGEFGRHRLRQRSAHRILNGNNFRRQGVVGLEFSEYDLPSLRQGFHFQVDVSIFFH